MKDIEKMTNSEWIAYMEKKSEIVKLKPNKKCSFCDIGELYTCFYCEIEQVERATK
jgi:hypothetical protein